MKLINTTVGCIRCKTPNKHKFDIYITSLKMTPFGKLYTENTLFDTVGASEVDYYVEQAKKLNGLEYNQEKLLRGKA